MLKFRVTNSTKARRAAEAQRRALEEKFQLEWAWKPMAAMMNEDKTDLVYWIPPLYSSNLMGTSSPRRPSVIGTPRRPSLTGTPRRPSLTGTPRRPSLTGTPRRPSITGTPRRPSLSRSYTLAAAATERKRRLATRRTKMTSEQIGDMPCDRRDSYVCDRRDSHTCTERRDSHTCGGDRRDSHTCENRRDSHTCGDRRDSHTCGDRRDSHTCGDRRDSHTCGDRRDSHTCGDRRDSHVSHVCDRRDSHIIPEVTEDLIGMKDEDTESGIHDVCSHTHSREDLPRRSFQSIQEERFPELQRSTFPGRPKVRCTSMKLRPPEKVCEGIRRASDSAAMKSKTLPSIFRLLKPSHHQKNKHLLNREVESRCYGSKKVKRPSIKIYNPPSRLSSRRARSSFSQSEEDDQCVIVSIDPKARENLRGGPIPDPQKAQQANKGLSGDTPKIRHAHLQMVLRLLAQMYEEKVVRQDTEIQTIKAKLLTQEKHLKRMVQMILHLKDEVNKMKNQRIVMNEQMKDIQSGILSVKVGEKGKTGIDV
ncbi:uncharacterized protein [Procambarus clarkii]|uniref:uncharacterized protein isoform X2 n=1 Tax=Procambarus clarkii TaxID=6728 RepID=UPI001E677476|nr:uncharacterized protein LOC123762929 isoform X2 [Procambarus clarkii]